MLKKCLLLLMLTSSLLANAIWYDFAAGGLVYAIRSDNTVQITYSSQSSKDNYTNISGTLVIPEKVTYSGTEYTVAAVGSDAFHHCSRLTGVVIPNTVTEISYGAFRYCTALESVDFGQSVQTIRTNAFTECSSLRRIVIPKSVTEIEGGCFVGCRLLSSISVDSENPNYDSRDNCNAIIETKGNTLVAGCTSTQIPETIYAIGPYAYASSNLNRLTLPNSVAVIADDAFNGCNHLAAVTLSNSLQSIGDRAFYRCYQLGSINLPGSLTRIGDAAFYECLELRELVIPDYTREIGVAAFSGCYRLAYVKFGTALEIIGAEAFKGCNRFTSLTIPERVSSIGKDAFAGCTNVTYVFWNARSCDNFRIGYYNTTPFNGLNGITSIDFGDTVEKIPEYICYEMKNLSKVTFGKSLKSIEGNAFIRCTNLRSVILPDGIIRIGDSAFRDCYNLREVYLGKSLLGIRGYVFYGCSNLESIVIPHTAQFINYYAFTGCKNLRSVTIGKGVYSILDYAFSGCVLLTTINSYPDAAKIVSMGTKVFEDVPQNVCELHVLPQYLDSYNNAPQWLNFLHKIGDLTDDTEGIEQVRIEQLDADLPMDIYDLGGVKINCAIENLPAGVYIVRQGNKIAKIAR